MVEPGWRLRCAEFRTRVALHAAQLPRGILALLSSLTRGKMRAAAVTTLLASASGVAVLYFVLLTSQYAEGHLSEWS
jgi:hypothetical protein